MKKLTAKNSITILIIIVFTITTASGQIGTRFPSEKKVVKDPVTGIELTFLTSTPGRRFKDISDS